LFEHPLL